jgi:phage-Barnase-EndoU-ColicinE5/D-RelE like nuclease4
MDAKKIIQVLRKGQSAYEKVVGQEIHYVYRHTKTNDYKELIFKPKKQNFLHLCGLKYCDSNGKEVNAKQFYNFLKQRKIKISGIKKAGYTDQKLQVIGELENLLDCSTLRIVDETTSYCNVDFEKSIRSSREIFALGLGLYSNGSDYYPKTLFNLKSNRPKLKSHPVQCIYTVHKNNVNVICRTTEFEEYEKKHTYHYCVAHQKILK